MQLPSKGKGFTKTFIFMEFLLQNSDVSLLRRHCEITGCRIEKIKNVLNSSLHPFSYNVFLLELEP